MANTETIFRQKFETSISHAAQQMGSKLVGKVQNETLSGEKQFFANYAEVTVRESTKRNAELIYDDPGRNRRMVSPKHFNYATLISKNDMVRMEGMAEPNGTFTQNLKYALDRRRDQTIIDALSETAYGGKDGTTTFDLAAANKVTEAGTDGLTITKLLTAIRKLDEADVPPENRCLLVGPAHIEDVLAITQVTSADYNSVRTLMTAGVASFLGFTWIMSTLLPTAAAATGNFCYAFGRDAIIYGEYPEPEVKIDEIAHLEHGTQVVVYVTCAAVRQYEEQVVQIDNDDN